MGMLALLPALANSGQNMMTNLQEEQTRLYEETPSVGGKHFLLKALLYALALPPLVANFMQA
ncbi:hypothetical protein CWN46_28600 [Klebsiella pneumoniae]|nr:hypothetical protein CWN46_28600 [Klebsiella pneumoniae]